MAVLRQKEAHLWERDPLDWYVEPEICSIGLFGEESFSGRIWDPACGLGRIVDSARAFGLSAVGTDIVRRSATCERTFDFLGSQVEVGFDHIVSNPPFRHAEEFVQKAIEIVPQGGKVGMLLPLVWLTGFSSKRDWLPRSPLKTLMPISPRPSMPPGAVVASGGRVGNGTKDFAWFVWQKGYGEGCNVRFLNTNVWKRGRSIQKHGKAEINPCEHPTAEFISPRPMRLL